jgi:hypothetical protein
VNYIVLNEKQLLNVNVLGLTYLKNMGIKWGFCFPPQFCDVATVTTIHKRKEPNSVTGQRGQ